MTTIRRAFEFRGTPFAAMVNPGDLASLRTWTEEQEVRDVLWKIQPGDLVFDVGCGFGSYSLTALAAGASHVHCWSLDPNHIELMAETLVVNGWSGRATLNATGLHDETGWLSAQESRHQVSKVPGPGRFCESLDDYAARLPREMKLPPFDYQVAARGRTWLKIDTQGDELAILQGAKQFIEDYQPVILLKSEALAPAAWLTSWSAGPGYKASTAVQDYGTWHCSYKP